MILMFIGSSSITKIFFGLVNSGELDFEDKFEEFYNSLNFTLKFTIDGSS